jgi:hypothetical protein
MNSDLLYPANKRAELRNSGIFYKTNNTWTKEKFNLKSRIGSVSYLTRLAHHLIFDEDYSSVMDKETWFQFYVDSGRKRRDLICKHNDGGYPHAYDLYYGRTLDDIYVMAKRFRKVLAAISINVEIDVAFNLCILRIIDEAYIGYIRDISALQFLISMCPDYTFSLANNWEHSRFGIDIIITFENKVIGGLQIKPNTYNNSKKKYIAKSKQMDEERFNTCFIERHFRPEYLYIDADGAIVTPLPNILKST